MKQFSLLKLLLSALALCFAAALTACVDDNEDNGLPYLEVTPAALAFDAQGQPTGEGQFLVRSNRPWRATVQEGKTWVRLSATEGNGDGVVAVSVPASNNNDMAKITFAVYNNYGAFLTQVVTVTQGSPLVIFNETAGTADVAANPAVTAYTGWQTSGEGASGVTYTGENATVRSTGKSNVGAYDGASGPNVVFLGKLPNSFVVQNIALTAAETNLRLTFGANFFDGSTNVFDKTKFMVSLSGDGVTYVPLSYDTNGGDATDPYWTFATANFTLAQASAKLYVKFETAIASAFRLDDITLQTGNGGQVIDLGGGGGGDAVEITIPQINALMTSTQTPLDNTNDRFVLGVVMNDVAGGNYSFNNLMIATEGSTAANNGVTLYGSQVEPSTLGLMQGDKVKITLKKGLAQVVNYNGMYEVTGSKDAVWCTVEKQGTAPLATATITPDQLAAYQAMAVTLVGASTTASGVWANDTALSKYTFTANSTDFDVFFKKGATAFVDQPFKAATGDISGLAAVNNNVAQLVPRNLQDVAAFNNSDPAITGVDPASVAFTAAGGEKTLAVTVANQGANTLSVSGLSDLLDASVAGNTVTVTAQANSGGVVNQTLSISLTNGNTVTVPVTIEASNAPTAYGWTLVSGDLGTTGAPKASVSAGVPEMTWAAAYTWPDGATKAFNFDATYKRGVQIGTGSDTNKCNTMSLTSSSYTQDISKIVIGSNTASSGNAVMTVSVNGTLLKCDGAESVTLNTSTTPTTYTFVSDVPIKGAVVISWTNSAAKALYLASVEINPSAAN